MRYFHQRNQGVSTARKLGIEHAGGAAVEEGIVAGAQAVRYPNIAMTSPKSIVPCRRHGLPWSPHVNKSI